MASNQEEKQGVIKSASTSKLVQDVIASFNAEKTWPSDVVLYTLPEEKVLLPDVAQCHVLRALFACHGLMDCYTIERRANAEFMAPRSRKLPFLRTGESVYAYEDTLKFMMDHNYVLKAEMNAEEKIQMDGLISLMETRLSPIEMYVTWVMNKEATQERYGRNIPQPLKQILCWQKYTAVQKYLKAIGLLEKSEEEIRREIVDIYNCINLKLENSGCLVGKEEVTEADVFVFGHLQAISESKLRKNILMEELRNFPKLTKFCLNFNQIHMGNKAMIWEFL